MGYSILAFGNGLRQTPLLAPPAPPRYLEPAAVDRNVVLLGKTGCGKSLLGNVMLGQPNAFKSECSTSSVTKGVDKKDGRIFLQNRQMDLEVYDTQGLRLSFSEESHCLLLQIGWASVRPQVSLTPPARP